jgi:hypothetical protein
MRRREFISFLVSVAATPLAARAQHPNGCGASACQPKVTPQGQARAAQRCAWILGSIQAFGSFAASKAFATARWASLFIVRAFFNDTITVAVWTVFHVRLTGMRPHTRVYIR